MIFNTPPRLPFAESVGKYVQTELYSWFRNLSAGLLKLNLVENFESFRVDDVVIAAGATKEITNDLRVVPTSKLIVRQTGNGLVTDGTWDLNFLRLINNGATTVTISVIFFR
jgi:hypothetical protein